MNKAIIFSFFGIPTSQCNKYKIQDSSLTWKEIEILISNLEYKNLKVTMVHV